MRKNFTITYKRGGDILVYSVGAKNKSKALKKWREVANADWAQTAEVLFIKEGGALQTELFQYTEKENND